MVHAETWNFTEKDRREVCYATRASLKSVPGPVNEICTRQILRRIRAFEKLTDFGLYMRAAKALLLQRENMQYSGIVTSR